MLKIHRLVERPVVLIRAATGYELTKYEREKLAKIEAEAQVNKLEAVSLQVGEKYIPVEINQNKEAVIDLGDLSLKDEIEPEDVSVEDIFFIKCELSDDELKENINE
jgi:hypothetical protein